MSAGQPPLWGGMRFVGGVLDGRTSQLGPNERPAQVVTLKDFEGQEAGMYHRRSGGLVDGWWMMDFVPSDGCRRLPD